MIICAGESEMFDFATPIGIGLIKSAINLTKLFLHVKPKNLLFVGSAGSYGDGKIFDIFTSNSASNIEIGFLENLSYSPIENSIKSINPNVSCETLGALVVNSSNFITSSEQQSNLFKKSGLHAENMEFFSILQVANEFKIPTLGLFCITNYCNKTAHDDFIKNHQKAKSILEKIVLSKYIKKFK